MNIDDVIRKIASVTKKYKGSTLTIRGSVDEINGIMSEKFAKIIQGTYDTTGKCCERCGISRLMTELQRCHAGRTRPDIAREAILTAECDEHGARYVRSIMINFITLHLTEPIKFMCEPCHNEFDKPKLPAAKKPAPKPKLPPAKKLVPKPKPPVAPKRPAAVSVTKATTADPVPDRINCRYRHLGCMSQLLNKNSLATHVSRDCKFRPTSSGSGSVSPGKVNCRYRHLGCQSQLLNKNSLYTHVSRDCKFRPTSSGGGSVSPGAGRTTC